MPTEYSNQWFGFDEQDVNPKHAYVAGKMQGTTFPGGHITFNATRGWAFHMLHIRILNEPCEELPTPSDSNASQPIPSQLLNEDSQIGYTDIQERQDVGQVESFHTHQDENNDNAS